MGVVVVLMVVVLRAMCNMRGDMFRDMCALRGSKLLACVFRELARLSSLVLSN